MTSIAAKLKAGGYATHFCGKWDGQLVFLRVCVLSLSMLSVLCLSMLTCVFVCVCVVGLCFWFNKSRHPVGSSGVFFVLNRH